VVPRSDDSHAGRRVGHLEAGAVERGAIDETGTGLPEPERPLKVEDAAVGAEQPVSHIGRIVGGKGERGRRLGARIRNQAGERALACCVTPERVGGLIGVAELDCGGVVGTRQIPATWLRSTSIESESMNVRSENVALPPKLLCSAPNRQEESTCD
jgi:hypothetical protein